MKSRLFTALAGASALSLFSVSKAMAFEDFHAAMKWAGDQEHAATVVALVAGSIVVGLMAMIARQPKHKSKRAQAYEAEIAHYCETLRNPGHRR